MSAPTMSQVGSDLQKLYQYQMALEGYQRVMEWREEVDGPVAHVMRVTLESIDPAFSIKDANVVTLAGIKSGIKVAYKATKDAIRYVFELIRSFFVKFTGSLAVVKSAQGQITKRLVKLGNVSVQGEMPISGIQRLSVNGEFKGNDLEALGDVKKMTKFFLETYPRAVANIGRNASRGALNIATSLGDNATPEKMDEEIGKMFAGVLRRDFNAPEGSAAYEEGLQRSPVLVGNMAFTYLAPNDVADQLNSGGDIVEGVTKALSIRFGEVKLGSADQTERDISVPSLEELKRINDQIGEIIAVGEKGGSAEKEFGTVKTVVDDAITQLLRKSEETGVDSGKVISMLGQVSQRLAEPMGKYTHWLAVTLNVWVTFLSHVLKQYEAKK
jgi:hypothetical protein